MEGGLSQDPLALDRRLCSVNHAEIEAGQLENAAEAVPVLTMHCTPNPLMRSGALILHTDMVAAVLG